MIEIRWHGRGGHGGFTAARLLGMAASVFEGAYAQAFPSFGPERRGAPVLGFTRIDARPITDHSNVYNCDFVVVLDETLMESVDVLRGLKPEGMMLVNSCRGPEAFSAGGRPVRTLDATALALEVLGQPVTNTAMLGALAGASGLVSLESALRAVDRIMPADLRDVNRRVVEAAYRRIRGNGA